jgi:ABC-type antimicrobial peptide transport system permease subunit
MATLVSRHLRIELQPVPDASVMFGVLIGVPVALAGARFASSQIPGLLFGISATDPVTIALAASLLIAVAAVASYFPARK